LALLSTLPSPNEPPAGGAMSGPMRTYQAHVRYATGESLDLTQNSRDWLFVVDRNGKHVLQTYYTGGSTFYMSRDGRAWEKIDYARLPGFDASQDSNRLQHSERVKTSSNAWRRLSDRTIAGRRYHRFATFTRAGRSAGPLLLATCLVDARTGLLRSCDRRGTFSATFDHYGDPINEFALPAAARQAREITLSP
jgi:hypothetical protein